MVITGEITIDGDVLHQRDAMEISDIDSVNIMSNTISELLFIEVSLE